MKSIRVLQSSLVLGALVAVAGFAACEGNIGSGGGGVGTATNPSGTGGTAGQSGAGTTTPGSAGNSASASSAATITADSPDALPPAAGAALTPESSGTLLMRRLVNAEYDNIMSHLLGDTTQPALLFPSDGIVLGNAPNTVADLNVQLYYQTAQTLVATALANPTAAGNQLQLPAGCSDTTAAGAAQTTCATQFITSFGLLAYRRPIATAEQTDLLTVFSTATGLGLSFTDSIGYVAQAMLQSPNFIYHWEIGPTEPTVGTNGLAPLTPWQVASRLSLELWNDMPDQTLLTAAQSGQLSTQAQVSAQATRMYADPKFAQALYDFHLQWLLDPAGNQTDLGQSIHSSPAFTTTVAQSLQTEFTDFLSSVYAPPGDGTLKTLLTATYTYANPALAAIYGVTVPGPGFSQVQLPATQRAGIFTQQAFLESQADTNADNPVRRGLCIYTQLLAGKVGNPPANVPSLPTTVSAGSNDATDVYDACCVSVRPRLPQPLRSGRVRIRELRRDRRVPDDRQRISRRFDRLVLHSGGHPHQLPECDRPRHATVHERRSRVEHHPQLAALRDRSNRNHGRGRLAANRLPRRHGHNRLLHS